MYEEVYTKVTVEVRGLNGDARTVTIQRNHWDLSAEDVAWMMHCAACSLGFAESNIDAGFRLATGCADACPQLIEESQRERALCEED